MARRDQALPENHPGDFYVDASCIDCAMCRQVAPAVFSAEGSTTEQSYVYRQPTTEHEIRRAALAVVACPTSSIGSERRDAVAAASRAFPEQLLPQVYFCGYAAESSFGAASYLIGRPEGNVLVDSPRFARPLVRQIEALGGIAMMFLTHRDDVADHARFHDHFGCSRVLHGDDVTPDTRGVEQRLSGTEPISLAHDLLAIPVPGHTRGSMALRFGEVLFTGDHLWGREDDMGLHASKAVAWSSWPRQVQSLRTLLEVPFRHVLPGHGMRRTTPTVADMHAELRTLLARLGEDAC